MIHANTLIGSLISITIVLLVLFGSISGSTARQEERVHLPDEFAVHLKDNADPLIFAQELGVEYPKNYNQVSNKNERK